MKLFKYLIAASAAVLVLATAAQAAPVLNGDILFDGAKVELYQDSNSDGIAGDGDLRHTDLSNATVDYIKFIDSPNDRIDVVTGSMANIVGNGNVTFVQNPLWTQTPQLNSPLWTVGDLVFELTSLDVATQNGGTGNNTGFLFLSGTGRFVDTSGQYADAFGTWSFTTQDPASGGRFSFSTSAEVPEPTSVALLGLGLAGLGVARRKFKA